MSKQEDRKKNRYDLAGVRLGSLTVVERTDRQCENGVWMWSCVCDCGTERWFSTTKLAGENPPLSCQDKNCEYNEWTPNTKNPGLTSEGAFLATAVAADKRYINPDGSWNLSNKTVRNVLQKHTNHDPFSMLSQSETSKLMADGGRRLDFTDTIMKLGQFRPIPANEEELIERLYEYFAVCQKHEMAPTYPLFAVWCGMSITRMEGQYARKHKLKDTVELCKETIRGFLELSAMDNALSPLIYFHQQKVYFGAVETSKIQVEEAPTDEEKLQELEELLSTIKPIEAINVEVNDVKKDTGSRLV